MKNMQRILLIEEILIEVLRRRTVNRCDKAGSASLRSWETTYFLFLAF